jgi:hypothetical protein
MNMECGNVEYIRAIQQQLLARNILLNSRVVVIDKMIMGLLRSAKQLLSTLQHYLMNPQGEGSGSDCNVDQVDVQDHSMNQDWADQDKCLVEDLLAQSQKLIDMRVGMKIQIREIEMDVVDLEICLLKIIQTA